MRINKYKSIFSILSCLLCFSVIKCVGTSDNNSENEFIVNSYKMTVNKNALNWNCQGVNRDTFCFPKSWIPVKSQDVYFSCLLDSVSHSKYFAILKQEATNYKTIDNYYKKVYDALLNDSTQKGKAYSVKKLYFKSGLNLYYGEFFQEIGEVEYKTFSMVFLKEGNLFDIGLKVEKDSSSAYQDIFKNIVFNTKLNGLTVFDPADIIEKFEVIDISKL